MITLAFDPRSIGLGKNGDDLVLLQIPALAFGSLLNGNPQDRGALRGRQRFAAGHEAEKAMQRGQAAVPGSNRGLAYLFEVFEEGKNFDGRKIGQVELGNGLRFLGSYKTEKQSPR